MSHTSVENVRINVTKMFLFSLFLFKVKYVFPQRHYCHFLICTSYKLVGSDVFGRTKLILYVPL